MNFRFTPRAESEAEREREWWCENRTDSPDLFDNEIADAIEKIRRRPTAGTVVPASFPEEVRKVRLRKRTEYTSITMQPVKAHVKNGRLVLDEPTDLPEGTEGTLSIADDDLDDEDRARLHAALERSMAQAKAGKLVDADDVIARLLARE
jgi:plasmid stabilization system protein ParE